VAVSKHQNWLDYGVTSPKTTAAIKAATKLNYKARDDIGCNHQRIAVTNQVNKKCGMGFFAPHRSGCE